MAKYQVKIEVTADPAIAVDIEPNLEAVEKAIEATLGEALGPGYTVHAYDAERTDLD